MELLRHAGAEPRDEWAEPDHRRPLDDTGREQAAALVDSLRPGPPITDILSSPAVRCRQTVEPLARALGLEIRCDERLDEVEAPVADEGEEWVSAAWKGGRALRLLDELTSGTVDGRVVCCSHGDVIPATVALLAGRDGLPLSEVRCRKAGRFTLSFRDGRCVAATAVPPPPVGRRRPER